MASMNYVILVGGLSRDPQVRRIPSREPPPTQDPSHNSDMVVADLSLAITEKFKGKNRDWQERTTFVDVAVWGRQAEFCEQYLHKGSPILVEGRLQLDQWEKDGEKRSKLKVRADRIQSLASVRRNENDNDKSSPQTPSPASTDAAPQDLETPF